MNEAASQFRTVAERFCGLIEGYDGKDWSGFERTLRKVLAALIHAAYALPEVEPNEVDSPGVPHDEWQRLYDQLKHKLAVQEYWMVFDPLESSDPEPVCADLADDLADIWRDLQVGLRTDEPGDAIWNWRFNFHAHWGSHATAALFCLQQTASIGT